MFAHNSPSTDYYELACLTANRINDRLNLPVTVVTDRASVTVDNYKFDNTILVDVNDNDTNYRLDHVWYNKNRFRAYEVSPYDNTLIVDVDYIVNSNTLLEILDDPNDFKCYSNSRYLMTNETTEPIGNSRMNTVWATIMKFRKTERAQQIFELVQMIQQNWVLYAALYKFPLQGFRNDFALTFALKIVNGHLPCPQDYLLGTLNQVGFEVAVERVGDTSYKLVKKDPITQKVSYSFIKDVDLHILDKKNYKALYE